MPLIDLIPRTDFRTCSILRSGVITFPQTVVESLGWIVPGRLGIAYINRPLTILLRQVNDEPGFSLHHHYRGPKAVPAGGKIKCTLFAKEVLRTRVVLPIRYLQPIYLSASRHQLALLLEEPEWVSQDFSQAGCKQIPMGVKGVYQLLDSRGTVLRIGEGNVADRIRRHLQDEHLLEVVSVQYCSLEDKDETSILQKILLAQYEAHHSKLPPLNPIRS